MPPLPSEWLRDLGIATFAPSAISDIGLYAEGWARSRAAEPDQENLFRSFIEFGAVEFALEPIYRGSLLVGQQRILEDMPAYGEIFPISVSDTAAADSVYKTDCGPFSEHRQKNRSELRPWDVFTFAGDMSKVELLGYSDDVNRLADPEEMQNLIEGLSERYSRAGLGSRVVESGLLAAQGLVWFAKLALLREEDYTDTRGLRFMARFLRGTASAG
jgi:hypothetical protein